MKPYLAVKFYDKSELKKAIRKKQDEFLDVYSLYMKCGIAWVHDELNLKAHELRLLDPSFKFKI